MWTLKHQPGVPWNCLTVKNGAGSIVVTVGAQQFFLLNFGIFGMFTIAEVAPTALQSLFSLKGVSTRAVSLIFQFATTAVKIASSFVWGAVFAKTTPPYPSFLPASLWQLPPRRTFIIPRKPFCLVGNIVVKSVAPPKNSPKFPSIKVSKDGTRQEFSTSKYFLAPVPMSCDSVL